MTCHLDATPLKRPAALGIAAGGLRPVGVVLYATRTVSSVGAPIS